MNIKIIDKNGVTLKTKGKYCKEDISVSVDESILGLTPTGTYQVTDNGEYDITEYAKVNVNVASSSGTENTLKKLLDSTKSCKYFFSNSKKSSVEDLIKYSDTENVTDMSYMFYNNTYITTAPSLDTKNVNNMSYMFNTTGSGNITDFPYNTSKVTDMSYMLFNQRKLKRVKLDLISATNISYMCRCCYCLEEVDISNYNISTSQNYVWDSCYSLKALIIRSFGTKYSINANSLTNCYHLTGTVNSTYNPNGDKDGFIYVPRSMVDTLKSATNWSTYADQIRALEDYTVDGTTTGDLDESKI